MLTIDTSGMLALLNRKDPHADEAKAALLADPGPYYIPTATLCELSHFTERRSGPGLELVLADIQNGAFVMDCGDEDLRRVRELLARYADLRLGFTDAAVIACAERNRGKVLTFDRRDFDVIAREGRITIVPA